LQSRGGPYIIGGPVNSSSPGNGNKTQDTNFADLSFTATQSFTLSAWINPALTHGFGTNLDGAAIIAKSTDQGSQYGFWINTSGFWETRGPNGNLDSQSGAQSSAWTHLAVVQDGIHRFFYVNGVLQAQGPAQDASGPGDLWLGQQNKNFNLVIGNTSDGSTYTDGFSGDIDEVRIYNVALTPQQILNQASSETAVLEALSIQTVNGKPVGIPIFPTPSGLPGTEPRVSSNGSYTIRVQFSQPLPSTPGAILKLQSGGTSAANVTLDPTGTVATIALASVSPNQALDLQLTGLPNDSSAATGGGTYDLLFGVLQGDVSGDHKVDSFDVAKITSVAGTTPTVTALSDPNAAFDLNLDGVVNATDVQIAKSLVNSSTWTATGDTYLSVFKTVAASTTFSTATNVAAINAVDNIVSATNIWENATSDNSPWIYVNLGTPATVDGFKLIWNWTYNNNSQTDQGVGGATAYTVQACTGTVDSNANCSSGWQNMVNETSNTDGSSKTYAGLTPIVAQYFRLNPAAHTSTGSTLSTNYALEEFYILGSFAGSGTQPTPPTVTTQPASQTVAVGSAVTFSVQATGSGTLTYAWSKNGTPIAGAASSTFTIASVAATDAGSYAVVVTSSNGTSTSSTAATLTVNASPTITTQPASQTVAVGSAVTFSVQATGSGTLTYAWSKNGTPIAGATSSTFTIASVAATDAGSYTVVVTSSNGTSTSSTAATLTVSSGTGTASTGTPIYQIDAGSGAAVGTYTPDAFFISGNSSGGSGPVTVFPGDSATAQVYLTNRVGGTFSYKLPGLQAGATYTAVLHFAETYAPFTTAGQRVFQINFNNNYTKNGYDIVAAAGRPNVATTLSQTVTAVSDPSGGAVSLFFAPGPGGVNNPQVNGIELLTNNSSVPPAAAPVSVVASAGLHRASLVWAAGNGPTGLYNIYRSTSPTSQGTLLTTNGQMQNFYLDATLTEGTTYYYTVTATNSGGTTAAGVVSVTTGTDATKNQAFPGTPVYQIAAGSKTPPVPFTADPNNYGTSTTGSPINLNEVLSPAPPSVYQTDAAGGSISYTFSNLAVGATYTVRLHFAEPWATVVGQRAFNVFINSATNPVLTNFDIYGASGGKDIGIIEQFQATATASSNGAGQIVVTLSSGSANQPTISGLELYH